MRRRSVLLHALALAAGAAAQEQLLREAARLDAEHKCEEAEAYYQKALAAGPLSPALLNNAGNHYLACGQPEKARSFFERLLEVNSAHPNANLQLARLAAGEKQGAKALAHLARLPDSDPAVRLLRAEASHWAGQRAAALTMLASFEKDARGDARMLFALGITCARLGLYDRAAAAFNAVLVERPGDFDALFNLGRAAARAQHYERAQRALEVAGKLRPGDVEVLFELGRLHAASQDSPRAVFVLAQARQRAPQRADIALALARAAEDAGYWGDSALAYDDYLALQPADDSARRDRARVYGYTGTRLQEGLKEMAWYAAKHPGDPVGHYNLAQFSWQSDPEKSLEQLAAALRLDANFAPAHVSRAWLLHRLGRSAEAVPHLQAALRITPGNLRALDQLGLVYLALDQPVEAEKVLRQALALAPADPEALLHMGRALMALGRQQEAQGFLEKYREVRPPKFRDPRKEPGMIALATLPEAERAKREIERFREMARSRPDDAKLQLHLAELLLAAGLAEEGLRAFGDLQKMNADRQVWEDAGRSLLRAGHYELAREFLQRAAARLDLALAVFFSQGPQPALKLLQVPPEGAPPGDYLLLKAKILDAAGQGAEAEKVLTEGLRHSISRPQVAQEAALLLLRRDRHREALELLSQGHPDLLLLKAITLALMDQPAAAEKTLAEIAARWPEWDRPYLVHGLLLERADKASQARQKLQTALALGSDDLALRCALARLSATPAPDPQCACLRSLREWLFPTCAPR